MSKCSLISRFHDIKILFIFSTFFPNRSMYNFWVIFDFNRFCKDPRNGSMDFFLKRLLRMLTDATNITSKFHYLPGRRLATQCLYSAIQCNAIYAMQCNAIKHNRNTSSFLLHVCVLYFNYYVPNIALF